jgi:hypothetical protein
VSLFHKILFNEQSSEKKKFTDLNPELWGEGVKPIIAQNNPYIFKFNYQF